MMTINELLRHPVTAASGVFTTLAAVFQLGAIDAIAAVVWSQVATLFTVFSISAFTVLPNVNLGVLEPVGEIATVAAMGLGALYVAKLTNQFVQSVKKKL